MKKTFSVLIALCMVFILVDIIFAIDPVPDIKANGQDGSITVSSGTPVSITVSLDPDNLSGQNADWWVAESTPSGTFNYYNLSTGSMVPGLLPTHQGPLFNLGTTQLLNSSDLTVGTHTFYFGVDMIMNGSLDFDQLYYDSVVVYVTSLPEDDISMITPYVNESDMANVDPAYSETTSAPWGFEHGGLDPHPIGDLKPFRAVASGVVDEIDFSLTDMSANWQVTVIIKYNSTYSHYYGFEPMSPNQADGETQLANITVSVGQTVSQGDIIGYLLTSGEGAHVHFGLFKYVPNGGDPVICPEPYFTPEARNSILNLIHVAWPGANMCY